MTLGTKIGFVIVLTATGGLTSDLVGMQHEKDIKHIKSAAYYSALKVKFLQLRNDYINAARAEAGNIQANLAAAKERLGTLYKKGHYFDDEYSVAGEQIAKLQADYQDARVRMTFNNLDLINQLQAGITFHGQAGAKGAKEAGADRFQDHRQQVVARYQDHIDTSHIDSVPGKLSEVQSYIDRTTKKFNTEFASSLKSLTNLTTPHDIEPIAQQAFDEAQ
jgi:hypothetical protein